LRPHDDTIFLLDDGFGDWNMYVQLGSAKARLTNQNKYYRRKIREPRVFSVNLKTMQITQLDEDDLAKPTAAKRKQMAELKKQEDQDDLTATANELLAQLTDLKTVVF
jgi:hypothetical protein